MLPTIKLLPALWLAAIGLALAGCTTNTTRLDADSAATTKALAFLQREVPAWSKENGCYSCHNNGDAARALYAAKRKGYRIPNKSLADTTAWVLQPHRWKDNKGDPGFSDQRLANLQFAASLLAASEAGLVQDSKALQTAARKVAADQSPNGAWDIEPGNAVGSPATLGTTLATHVAMQILARSPGATTRDALTKAKAWLRHVSPDNVVAAATLVLDSAGDSSETARQRRDRCWEFLRRAQTSDGGWGPYLDSPPEAFDTAIALLALTQLPDLPEVRLAITRGRAYLAAQQQSDGGWPATTRPPGGESYAQRLSTTGWVTQALIATGR